MLSDWQYILAQLLAEGGIAFADFLISLGKRGVTISSGISLSLCYNDIDQLSRVGITSARWKAPSTISDPTSSTSGSIWLDAESCVAKLRFWTLTIPVSTAV